MSRDFAVNFHLITTARIGFYKALISTGNFMLELWLEFDIDRKTVITKVLYKNWRMN